MVAVTLRATSGAQSRSFDGVIVVHHASTRAHRQAWAASPTHRLDVAMQPAVTRVSIKNNPAIPTPDPFNCREPEPDRQRAPTTDQQDDDRQQCETEPAEWSESHSRYTNFTSPSRQIHQTNVRLLHLIDHDAEGAHDRAFRQQNLLDVLSATPFLPPDLSAGVPPNWPRPRRVQRTGEGRPCGPPHRLRRPQSHRAVQRPTE
jgi:hypothetical protein